MIKKFLDIVGFELRFLFLLILLKETDDLRSSVCSAITELSSFELINYFYAF